MLLTMRDKQRVDVIMAVMDGIDDDGDGRIDEGFGVGSKCIKEGDTTCSPTGIKACSDDHTGTICQ